ncbi:hypothetical protein VIGAN_11167300, partial [Vigna angularis var. angularis]
FLTPGRKLLAKSRARAPLFHARARPAHKTGTWSLFCAETGPGAARARAPLSQGGPGPDFSALHHFHFFCRFARF